MRKPSALTETQVGIPKISTWIMNPFYLVEIIAVVHIMNSRRTELKKRECRFEVKLPRRLFDSVASTD